MRRSVLGSEPVPDPRLGRALAEDGHEVAVHGWDHRCLPGRGPLAVDDDLARAAEAVERRTPGAPGVV
jgi:peptidoglycan-N-acetylglucosamine deacetylase